MDSLLVPRWTARLTSYGGDVRAFGELPADLARPLRALGHYERAYADVVDGHWSGVRSRLVERDGQLFRLKGVAFDLPPEVTRHSDGEMYSMRIEGGQFLQNARNERASINRFNRVLAREGIDSVVEMAGFYLYPDLIKGGKMAGSVFSVKGDTRLDELFAMVNACSGIAYGVYGHDDIGRGALPLRPSQKLDYIERAYDFGTACGKATGYLVRLLHKNGLSWSDNPHRSNAHIGNIVVVPDGDVLRLGLVDFDASCTAPELGRTALKRQQEQELVGLKKDLFLLSQQRMVGAVGQLLTIELVKYNLKEGFRFGVEVAYLSRQDILPEVPREMYDRLLCGLTPRMIARIAREEFRQNARRVVGQVSPKRS